MTGKNDVIKHHDNLIIPLKEEIVKNSWLSKDDYIKMYGVSKPNLLTG
ncbi:MAG: hypothetical protein K0R98_1492 [Rickettsiaceae bacterium]|nr:hypothetical protein [Rickettsiaceae bacterium]